MEDGTSLYHRGFMKDLIYHFLLVVSMAIIIALLDGCSRKEDYVQGCLDAVKEIHYGYTKKMPDDFSTKQYKTKCSIMEKLTSEGF